MTHDSANSALQAICLEMSLTLAMPDAELLDNYVKQYPQFSDELTDFAVALALDSLAPIIDEDIIDDAPENMTPAVSRTMSFFQNALFDARQDGTIAPLETKQAISENKHAENPIATLSKTEFKGFVRRMDINSVLAAKLRDRQIDPATIPQGFVACVAENLPASLNIVSAHLMAPPAHMMSALQFHKADGKPGQVRQESYEEAVKGSGLSDPQQCILLEY
ncbi:hypothetical protein [Hyphomonas sp.]|uniref:hypothetical protein n=1 Tax=Hyphomonas sp. TaxID=87 RepID=UPI003F719826